MWRVEHWEHYWVVKMVVKRAVHWESYWAAQ